MKKLVDDYEREWTYDDASKLTDEHTYGFEGIDERTCVGQLAAFYKYDDNGNLIESNFQGWNGGPDGQWVNTTCYYYTYEQDSILTKNMGYGWNGSEWTERMGNETIYDYDVPVENLIIWPGSNAYHKIAETRQYMPGACLWLVRRRCERP